MLKSSYRSSHKQSRFLVFRLPHLPMFFIAALMIISLLGIRSWAEVEPTMTPALFGQSIVIDAGHGGYDPGVVGEQSVEKDINLAIAKALAEYCRSAGANVSMTRQSDTALGDSKTEDLSQRVALCEQAQADVFISLHCNSYVNSPSQHGAQIFYQSGNDKSRLLAESVQAQIAQQLANTDRSALTHPNSYLLKNIPCAAVICEMGFLSNNSEEDLLNSSDYQWDMAWSIFCGLADYLAAAN